MPGQPLGHVPAPYGQIPSSVIGIPGAFPIGHQGAFGAIPGLPPPQEVGVNAFLAGGKSKPKSSSAISIKLTTSSLNENKEKEKELRNDMDEEQHQKQCEIKKVEEQEKRAPGDEYSPKDEAASGSEHEKQKDTKKEAAWLINVSTREEGEEGEDGEEGEEGEKGEEDEEDEERKGLSLMRKERQK